MPASTPFLGLYKPGGGSTGLITPDEVVDIDRLNTNSDLIDAFAKSYGPATERNRQLYGPAASLGGASGMKLGDTYQESDGNKVLWKYNGTNWVSWDSDWLTASAGISASSGAINDGRASHRYKYASGAIIDTITINITNAGTGSGALNVEMPFTVVGTWIGTGRSEIDGSQLQGRVQGNSATVFKYNNAPAIAVGTMYLTVVCGA